MWYGWQILIPGAVADGLFALGFFVGGVPVWVASAITHGISGPIVHLANRQPLKAGLSFLMEGVVPGAILTGGAVSLLSRDGDETAGFVLLAIVFPITWVAGMAVDTAVLARKEVKTEPEKAPAISLAPFVVSPFRTTRGAPLAKGWFQEMPVGLSLGGRF